MYRKVRALAARLKNHLRGQQVPLAPILEQIPPAPANLREWAAQTYLQGEGIEIGGLHKPLHVPPQAHVKYVDRMPVAQLREHYPELASWNLVEVDIVDDGEKLGTLPPDSQDFLIANHFLEHCGDPIGTLKNFLRVVRPQGILYVAVPDKRYTFDRDRPVTSLAHLFEDHERGPEQSRRQHFEEWVRLVSKVEGPAGEAEVERLLEIDYSIHYHVWTQTEFLELLHALKEPLGFEIEVFLKHDFELITVLRKIGQAQKLGSLRRRSEAA